MIRRYIRLTNFVPELLEFVDLEKIKLCPAVELSYLDEEAQRDVVDQIDETDAFPSHAQAIHMRKAFEQGKLGYDLVSKIMKKSQTKSLSTSSLMSACQHTFPRVKLWSLSSRH